MSYVVPRPSPHRIVCLSAEAVETLFRLGCRRLLVGVTAYAVQSPAARRLPRVSGFSSVNFNKIDALKPDLIVTFSDVQADAARELVRRGHTVLATNPRSLDEIFQTILLLGRIVGREGRAEKLIAAMRKEIFSRAPTRNAPPLHHSSRPRVYFEEWHDPLISGIRWVSELIEAAGGRDIFPELRNRPRAPDRVVLSEEVIRRQPDIIIASWCGKKVNRDAICARPGWDKIPAIRNHRIYEIDSAHILQPGPALLKGFRKLRRIIHAC